jgi:hypothetical protein
MAEARLGIEEQQPQTSLFQSEALGGLLQRVDHKAKRHSSVQISFVYAFDSKWNSLEVMNCTDLLGVVQVS